MERLTFPEHDVIGLRADNPGPFTLSGTNTWIVGSDPAWLIDPGPALPAHLAAVAGELEARGGLGGIALTHDHADHAEAVPEIRSWFPEAPLAAARPHPRGAGEANFRLADGQRFGPLRALATPGHAPDHLAYLTGSVAIVGDAVLGEGSVFITPDPGALAGYLVGLGRLRESSPVLLLPGHGPVVSDPGAKLDAYVAHRTEREQRLVQALSRGARTVDAMLDGAWPEVPGALRPAAAITLAAHLDKLEDEGRLPAGVERPEIPDALRH